MPTKRHERFLDAVAKVAREACIAKPRGRPTPENLTAEGRALGLFSMQASPRCRAKRRNGTPCKAPALKGATRCVKHGGRVEVPDHPHNIRRFFSGALQRETVERADRVRDREAWDSMPPSQQRELASLVSERVLGNPARLYHAARVWMVVKDEGHAVYKRFLDAFARV